jgi:predicted metal-dependent hydrolase
MRTEIIKVNNEEYRIRMHYENRKSVHASIGKKQINIRIPISLNREEQLKELTKMKAWVIKKLQESPDRFKKQWKEYKNGEILKVGDTDYIINIGSKDNKRSSFKYSKIA